MSLVDNLKRILGSAWHVNSDNFFSSLLPETDGTAEASKVVTTDANGNVTLPGQVAGAGGVGYVAGQGGAVTQATDRATGVTLNTLTGQITTNNASLAAAAKAAFTVTNSKVGADDIVVASVVPGGTGTPRVDVIGVAAGSFILQVTNDHASTADTSADKINFAVIKGAAA